MLLGTDSWPCLPELDELLGSDGRASVHQGEGCRVKSVEAHFSPTLKNVVFQTN